jgi:NAD(P)H-flavin reductase
MYRITEKQRLSDAIVLITVEAPHVARSAKPGQFVVSLSSPMRHPLGGMSLDIIDSKASI